VLEEVRSFIAIDIIHSKLQLEIGETGLGRFELQSSSCVEGGWSLQLEWSFFAVLKTPRSRGTCEGYSWLLNCGGSILASLVPPFERLPSSLPDLVETRPLSCQSVEAAMQDQLLS
jgi:hypothetical protein